MCRTHAPAIPDGGLGLDDTLLVRAVVISVSLVASLHRRIKQGVVQGILVRDLGHTQGPPFSAYPVSAFFIVLHALEQRFNVRPTPAPTTQLRPGFVVQGLAAHIDQTIYGR